MIQNVTSNQDNKTYYENNGSTQEQKDRRSNISNILAGLDGDNGSISLKDLENSKKLIGSNGIENVRRDANAGIINVYVKVGELLEKISFKVGEKTKAVTEEPNEPKKPAKDATVTYTIKDMDNLIDIANKYHTTADEIAKYNNIDKNKLSIGQKLVIETYKKETWDNYQKALKQYDKDLEAYYTYQEQKEFEENIKHAKEQIALIKKHYGDKYEVTLKKDANGKETGEVIIKVLKDTNLRTIKKDLGIGDNTLTVHNTSVRERDEEQRKINNERFFRHNILAYIGDNQPAEIGRTLEIPAYAFKVKVKD